MAQVLIIYVVIGALVGLLAGLMGSGGGMVMIPILHYTFALQGIDASVIHHMALATSMANILFTSSLSTYAHHKRGAVPWQSVFWMVPGILAGSFAGSFLTRYIPGRPLTLAFGIFLIFAAVSMFIDIKPKASRHLPGAPGLAAMGLLIGMFSGLLGIGGAFITMPMLLICNVPLLSVIAIAGAFGFPIALAGSAGYIFAGLGHTDLPAYSLGFIYLPALLGLTPTSLLLTPYAVRLAHKMPQKILRRCVGLFVAFMAYKMISVSI